MIVLTPLQAYIAVLFVVYLWLIAGLGFAGQYEVRLKTKLTFFGTFLVIFFIPVLALIGAISYLRGRE